MTWLVAVVSALLASYTAQGFQQQQPLMQPRKLVSPRKMAVDPVSVTKAVAAIPTLYALMSVNEYVTHRYYQHAEFNKSPFLQRIARAVLSPFGKEVPRIRGGGHVEHHAETLDDMTLKTDDQWRSSAAALSLDSDPYRGTAFTWFVSFLMTVQMVPTVVPVFTMLFGFSLQSTFAMLVPALLLHTLVWNSLHPAMHSLPDVPLGTGPPSSVFARFRDSAYFRFLYDNHHGHHVVGGRGNYNVCLPGADHLFGTYVPEKEWRPKVSTNFAAHHGVDIPVDQQIKLHVTREKEKVLA